MTSTSPRMLAGAATLLCVCLLLVEIDIGIALIVLPSSSKHHSKHRRGNGRCSNDDSNPILGRRTTTTVIVSATHSEGGSDPQVTHPNEDGGAASTRNTEETTDGDHRSSHQDDYHPPRSPMDLEQRLLLEHDALESFLAKPGVAIDGESTASRPPEPQPHGKNGKSSTNNVTPTSSVSSRSIPYFLRPVPYFLDQQQPPPQTSARTNTTTDRASMDSAWNDLHKIAIDGLTATNDTDSEGDHRRASIDRAIYAFNKNLVDILYAAISHFYPTAVPCNKPSDPVAVLSPLIGTEYNEAPAPTRLQPQNTQEHNNRILRFEKFYVFETVARIPYFAYLSVLHLRETLGDQRSPFGSQTDNNHDESSNPHCRKRIETMRTHYAQADNEVHHLLIMEELGGNSRRIDRLLAHSMAFFYYWFVVLVFFWNEQAAYHLNEVVEDHAYKIYQEFVTLYEDELRALPVPEIARKYYEVDYQNNPHLFETFCTVAKCQGGDSNDPSPRRDNRPHELHSLYDVFRNIRDDEKEHWMALCNLVQYDDMGRVDETNVQSTKTGETL